MEEKKKSAERERVLAKRSFWIALFGSCAPLIINGTGLILPFFGLAAMIVGTWSIVLSRKRDAPASWWAMIGWFLGLAEILIVVWVIFYIRNHGFQFH